MKFYVVTDDPDAVRSFFEGIEPDKRPKVVSAVEHPKVWELLTDQTQVITTPDQPPADADATPLDIEGRQPEDVVDEIKDAEKDGPITENSPEADAVLQDAQETEDSKVEVAPIRGPRTYHDRGFFMG